MVASKNTFRPIRGKKTFSCTQCEFSCITVSYLKKHMLIHSGEKPFRCYQCNYCCAQTGDLRSHMLTHTGEKPFACKQCSYSSRRSRDLKSHMFSHTGEKPFVCKQCNYSCKHSRRSWRNTRESTQQKEWHDKNRFSKKNYDAQLFDSPDCIILMLHNAKT